ncbi:MAG: pseudouridine synthase [Porphyromonas sp.]|nr:pseudouridine synthase [Porphyromonas sp.]
MSIEEQSGGSSAQKTSVPKRIPVASADGRQSARLNDQQVAGKRKRVRISMTDNPSPVEGRRLSTRFDRERFSSRDEYPSRRTDLRQERYSEERSREYDERYQAQRREGNYDRGFKRATAVAARPQRPTVGAKPNKKSNNKPKNKPQPKPKKDKKAVPLFVPQEAPEVTLRYPEEVAPNAEIRINKFLANAGVCSRREADLLIASGEISVNGEVITELGRRVTPQDIVEYKGQRVQGQSKVYVLLNKPKNCVTTSDDPECRLTVMDLVKNACPERIYPVGRLDRNTTGVLLITNDGDLAAKLTHPSFLKKKIYHVWLDKPVSVEHMQAIADGFELEDGEIHADAISYVTEEDLSQVGIEIHSGRNRIVRRIFEHFGYHVAKLDRVYFAGLTKKNLPRGRWRYLDAQEVANLRMGAFE